MAWRCGLLCFQRIFLPLDIQMVSVLLKLGSKMALTSGIPKIGNASDQLVNLVPRASAPSEDKPIHGFAERWAKSVGESLGCVLRGDILSPVLCPHSLHPASELLCGRSVSAPQHPTLEWTSAMWTKSSDILRQGFLLQLVLNYFVIVLESLHRFQRSRHKEI